jgi:hypothetical protein
LSYVLFDCVVLCIVMCVNVYYCHRVSTQLQLNISYHIIFKAQWLLYVPPVLTLMFLHFAHTVYVCVGRVVQSV